MFLAEGQMCFGGMDTAGGLPLMCSFTDGMNFVADGVGRRIYERLHEAGAVTRPSMRGNRDVYYDPELLKCIYDNLVAEARVEFTFGTHAIAVEAKDG